MIHICMCCKQVMKDDLDGDERETHGLHLSCASEVFGPEIMAEYQRQHPQEVTV